MEGCKLRHGLAPEDLKLLAYRIKRILTRLEGVSEAHVGVPMEDRLPISNAAAADPRPPKGVRDRMNLHNEDRDRPPSRDLSLFEHYRWRFEKAQGDLDRLELLCVLAERDYWEATGRGSRTRRPAREEKGERDRRIVNEYEGVAAIEVACFERIDTSSVRKVRKEYGRDPLYGGPTTSNGNGSSRSMESMEAVA